MTMGIVCSKTENCVVALCGDLFVKYEREKQIFQMLFQAGLGEDNK